MVEAHDVVLGAQHPVGGDELEVARGRPAVQQQDRRTVGVVMAMAADEELASTFDAHDQSRRRPRHHELGHRLAGYPRSPAPGRGPNDRRFPVTVALTKDSIDLGIVVRDADAMVAFYRD